MIRRRSTPWIHQKSRFIIASVAAFGAVIAAYLTFVKLTGGSAACPTTGCDQVLESPYAIVFGLPLPLFGLVAYIIMAGMAVSPWLINTETQKSLRTKTEDWTWILMFAQASAMMIFSFYLMYIMAFVIKALCIYCTASAICSISLFLLVLLGKDWEDRGQLFFIAVVVAMITLIGTLAVYAPINSPRAEESQFNITTISDPANIELAEYLTQSGAKMYGAFWCGHCHDQKQLFGQQAVDKMPYIECDKEGKNPQLDLCKAKNIEGYPTWEIKGKMYTGIQSLEKLSEVSGYKKP
ncbi:vitamin K epoxide reductase family protein [Planktothrix agardhii]|uniref:vitamin K epoxide reductase family protein n=1 Tax=Planktothrix agardhii TaxID=1160 RepID=UPI001F2302BD|nr:vitamin K epoxide reductase family protein [Planktothrix agardhii]MCF3576716.1 vitamin K epoxide reductase family protein [Planktothrix agardhii 1812]